ncbi:M48 family metalloprotease [Tahibacter amnicola]|uniref:Putative beta-barrel assembly-enhancing protease n=1 Tax=Tahibacter amnicola TaxID=2976241 RepID=A0ABY6BF11_9GAMM|nr:M48 family metalloprotease [Tahibacter amnicola]UXI66940.1 M48 family metalloprotease [Tahibacter amnicola]
MSPRYWLAFLLAFGSTVASSRENGVRLPDIGSSAAEILSPQQERAYGASMLHELRSMDLVLDDPLLSSYINDLGFRLVAHSDKPDHGYTFFVVRDGAINAFAAPGGFIGVNAGLITTATTESEVAAVLAHEIAHVTQNHLLRAFEDSQKTSLPIALAILGALIASQGSSGDAAQAAIVTGTSLMQQRQINFTRKDEIEADRVGIQTLARSQFDPDAMASFFARMERTLRPGGGGHIPDLLRTHPVNTDRISDAKARAASMASEEIAAVATPRLSGLPSLNGPADDDTLTPLAPGPKRRAADAAERHAYFLILRERARVLASDQPTALAAYYATNRKDQADFDTVANRYGHALALLRAGQPGEARAILTGLVAGHSSVLPFQLALAQAEARTGDRTDALNRYERLLANSPDNATINLSFAQTLIEDGKVASARRAQDLLRPMMAEEIDDPEIYRVFARASELSGDKIRAAEAYADVALLNGRLEDALNQLKALSTRRDLDYYQRSRIEARITEVTPYVLELRRRGIKPQDQGRLAPAFSCEDTSTCAAMSSRRNNPALQ